MRHRHLNFKYRNRLDGATLTAIREPVSAALDAYQSGTATAEEQATLAAALSVAYRVAESIPRHRHLLAELRPALDILTAIYERGLTGNWQSSQPEIAELRLAARIYDAVLRTSSGVHVRLAINRVTCET